MARFSTLWPPSNCELASRSQIALRRGGKPLPDPIREFEALRAGSVTKCAISLQLGSHAHHGRLPGGFGKRRPTTSIVAFSFHVARFAVKTERVAAQIRFGAKCRMASAWRATSNSTVAWKMDAGGCLITCSRAASRLACAMNALHGSPRRKESPQTECKSDLNCLRSVSRMFNLLAAVPRSGGPSP